MAPGGMVGVVHTQVWEDKTQAVKTHYMSTRLPRRGATGPICLSCRDILLCTKRIFARPIRTGPQPNRGIGQSLRVVLSAPL